MVLQCRGSITAAALVEDAAAKSAGEALDAYLCASATAPVRSSSRATAGKRQTSRFGHEDKSNLGASGGTSTGTSGPTPTAGVSGGKSTGTDGPKSGTDGPKSPTPTVGAGIMHMHGGQSQSS